MRRAAVLFALLAAVLAPTMAVAATTKASLVDIEDEVMCVSCEIPLNVAESKQADDERDLIRSLITQGKTKGQIKTALVAEYGHDVLALPDSSGFGITAYLVPIALVVVLAGGLALLLPRWRRRAPAAAMAGDDTPALTTAESRRLDDELARYER